jgi:hypothetical protein
LCAVPRRGRWRRAAASGCGPLLPHLRAIFVVDRGLAVDWVRRNAPDQPRSPDQPQYSDPVGATAAGTALAAVSAAAAGLPEAALAGLVGRWRRERGLLLVRVVP